MDGCAAGTGLTSGYEIDHFREAKEDEQGTEQAGHSLQPTDKP